MKLSLFLLAFLFGCTMDQEGYDRWHSQGDEFIPWAQKIRATCTEVGRGIERGHYSTYKWTLIYKCPDGSLAIVPTETGISETAP